MITTPILKLSWADAYTDDPVEWYFCRFSLHDVFDFPMRAKQIQLQAWPEPGRNRVEIKIGRCCVQVISEADARVVLCMRQIHSLTKRRNTWYVKLFYWE